MSMWAWCRRLLQGQQTAVVAVLLLGLVSALVALVPPYLTKQVIDAGLLAADRDALIFWSLALFVVGAGALALGVASSLLHMRASVEMLAALRSQLFSAVMQAPPAWRARHSTGELMSRIDGDAGEVQRFAFNAALTGSGAIVRLFGALVMLFWLYWPLAVLALLLAPLELLFLAWARPRTEALSRAVRGARGEFAGRLTETLHGLSAIRQIAAVRAVLDRLDVGQKALNQQQLAAHRFGEVTRTVPAVMTAIARSVVFLVGGLAVIDGQIALGTLIAFIAYLGFLIGPMQSLLGLWHGQVRARVAFERLGGIIAMAHSDDLQSRSDRHDGERGTDAIALDHEKSRRDRPGTFGAEAARNRASMPRDDTTGWTLTIHAGESRSDDGAPLSWPHAVIGRGQKVLLTGASGSGKSTLLRAIQGLDAAESNAPAADIVTCTDGAGQTVPQHRRREHIVHVPQRPFLLHATVAENLRLTAPDADDDRLRQVLTQVGLLERFAGPGLATKLGDDGLSLSGGERQRLCVARALLRRAPVWLFDEALSEVDRDRAQAIWHQIDEQLSGCIRIVVSHDPLAYGAVDQTITLGVS